MMVKTRVVWAYSIATPEEQQAVDNYTANPDSNSTLLDELNAKARELSGFTFDTAEIEYEVDTVNKVKRGIRTRTWPDRTIAEAWIGFVLSKGAESAVIVE